MAYQVWVYWGTWGLSAASAVLALTLALFAFRVGSANKSLGVRTHAARVIGSAAATLVMAGATVWLVSSFWVRK